MRKLIIIAQPSSKGFTYEILNTYKKKSQELGDRVRVIDLYKKKNYQPYLEFQNMKKLYDDPNRERFQKNIKWADEIVLIFPIWWGYMPAILKNFIDTNFTAKFAFKYRKGSSIPKWLLPWKTVKVFITCDAMSIIYNNIISPIYLKQYLKIYIFWMFWMKMTDYMIIDKMRKRSKEEKQKILETIETNLESESLKTGFKGIIKKILN